MSDRMLTQTETLRLLDTGEFITEREYQQREVAQADFRTRLLGEARELQYDLTSLSHAAATDGGRRKFLIHSI